MSDAIQSTRVVTGVGRISYAHIFEPRAIEEGKDPVYSCSLLIPKTDTDTIERLKTAIKAAIKAGESMLADKNGKIPDKPQTTIYDGDGTKKNGEEFGPEAAGCWVLNTTSKTKPGIVGLEKGTDGKPKEITDQTQVYSGCYVRLSVNFYAYNHKGNKGIGCAINGVQKVRDGEPLASRSNAKDDFNDGFEDSSDTGNGDFL